MAMQDYARPWIEVDGIRCMQAISISLKTESGKIEVYTIDGGFTGVTPGPGKCTVSIEYAIPAGGYEVNFQKMCCTTGRHTIQFGVGPLAYVGEGEFMDDDQKMSTKDSASGSVTWVGERSPIQ
jgi:L-fucose isomerase-like protein